MILRHAKAEQEGSASDKERELTAKGRKAARHVGEHALERHLVPDLVLCSTAARARETFSIFAEGCRYGGRVEFLDELYLAPASLCVESARRLGGSAQRLLLVGHNPGLEALVDLLTGCSEQMSTAALAVCELPIEEWAQLDGQVQGTLKAIFRPKEID